MNVKKGVLFILGSLMSAMAQEAATLEQKVEVLASEVERLKQGSDVLPLQNQGKFGLAPAASKVYFAKKGPSLGGYGEMVYNRFDSKNQSGAPANKSDQADFLRAVLYLGYRFDEQFVFNSEIEFEHTNTENAGGVSVEFATLDYLYKEPLNFRAGLVLIPMGFINEWHEPTTFLSVSRPITETRIIPATWRENGLGVFGEYKKFSYRFYMVNGFDAIGGGSSNAKGFSSAGLRDGRQNGSKALAEDYAFVLRADVEPITGLKLGGSTYVGQSAQNGLNAGGGKIPGWVSLSEGHLEAKLKGVFLRALVAFANVDSVGDINVAAANTPTGVAKNMLGGYVETGFNVLSLFQTEQALTPFVRFESVNTQKGIGQGLTKDAAQDEVVWTAGVQYKPLSQIVIKGDYQWRKNEADTGVDQFNVGLGYMF